MSETLEERLSAEPPLKRVLHIAYLTLEEWLTGAVIHWGAAISYYTLISLGPLLLFLAGAAGMLFDASSAQSQLLAQLRLVLGARGAEIAETVLRTASFPGLGSPRAVGSLILLTFGATAVFVNLQGALNWIWNVTPVTGTVRNMVRTRITAFLAILVLGAIAFIAFFTSTTVSFVLPYLETQLGLGAWFVRTFEFLASTAILGLLFGAAYQILPDAQIAWKDVWVGGFVTAILFSLGTLLIGSFLGRSEPGSMFGAAGSLFGLLVWIYYSAQIFLIGAAFTEVWARTHGRAIRPQGYAGRVTREVVRPSDPNEGVQQRSS